MFAVLPKTWNILWKQEEENVEHNKSCSSAEMLNRCVKIPLALEVFGNPWKNILSHSGGRVNTDYNRRFNYLDDKIILKQQWNDP